MQKKIPREVSIILETLEKAGFEAYIVGGSVRDLLLGKEPKDWDVTTNAVPERVQALFPDHFYENDFGTVGVKTTPFLSHGKTGRDHDVVEVTTYRIESAYSDTRRPDSITYAQTLAEDLGRRDFTMNAIAMDLRGVLTDPFGGAVDLDARLIRAVGRAHTRFQEDALRMMRAVRLAAELHCEIDVETKKAISEHSGLLRKISMERIQAEFSRIVMSDHGMHGIQMLSDTGLLRTFLPELEDGIGVEQNHHHTYTVWDHNLRALDTCPSKKLSVRLATLMHDIGKPESKRGKGRNCTFYNHEYIGERIVKKVLSRMKYPKNVISHTALLVRNHMFYYSVDEVTEASVRRVVKKVGRENMKDLMDVRIGDRLGSGTKKAKPYKLRHFEYMIEKVSKDPVSVKMLALNGDIMIAEMGFTPGPKIGAILDTLLAEVIEDASRNTLDYLKNRATVLEKEDLNVLRKAAKKRIADERAAEDKAIKSRHWVQ